MQIAKRFLVVCAATISFTLVTRCATADDSDVQTKAREALDKRLNEMQSQPAPAPAPKQKPPAPKHSPKPVAPKPTPPPPVAQSAPAENPQPSTSSSPTTTAPADSTASAKARDVQDQRFNELPSQPPPSQPLPAPQPPPPVAQQPPPPVAPPAQVARPQAKHSFSADVTATADSDAAARERAALDARLNQLQSQPVAQPAVQPEMRVQPTTPSQPTMQVHVTTPPLAPPKPPKMNPNKGFAPLPAPGSPLSEAKQQQLQDLLRKYRADEITPEQYHAERARILAEP